MTDDDPNQDAGFSAVANASGGDWTQLVARLIDPAVRLTMFERQWLARQAPGKPGRRKEAPEPLLCWWFQHAEGMDRNSAIKAACKALNKRTAQDEEAVMKALQRSGGDVYDPGEGWHRNARWYREGSRAAEILPPALRQNIPDFAAFLAGRT
jgi:hypothetical protein